MNAYNLEVLTNIIGAVESGGQIYGKRRYNAYEPPYKNSTKEHTITIGWAQCYGHEARQLVQAIFDADPAAARAIDKAGSIEAMLAKDWTAIRWNPTAAQKAVLVALIDSKTGHAVQDALFAAKMPALVADCVRDYPGADVKAQMMYCEIRHLGGKGPADRIFKRCGGKYDLDAIMASLVADQRDKSSDNQVGDTRYWSRHVKCRAWADEYAVPEDDGEKGDEMAKITEKDITLCGHGSGNPRLIRMDTYLSERYARTASAKVSGKTVTWHKGVVAVVRPKGLTAALAKKYVDTYKDIIGRNFYSQSLREYCYKKYKDGRYYSDCSSSQCLTLARIGLSVPSLNTVGMYKSSKFERVPVKIKDGHITNPEILKVGDMLLFAGSDYYRELHIGHVEGVFAINGDPEPTPEPTPSPDYNTVKEFQKFLNKNYAQIIKSHCGGLLTVDGDYGTKSRAAAVTVWKYMANKYYGGKLTLGNMNFFESAKAVSVKMTDAEVARHPTLGYLIQGILAGKGYYSAKLDGVCGAKTKASIKAFQKAKKLTQSGEADAATWSALFN